MVQRRLHKAEANRSFRHTTPCVDFAIAAMPSSEYGCNGKGHGGRINKLSALLPTRNKVLVELQVCKRPSVPGIARRDTRSAVTLPSCVAHNAFGPRSGFEDSLRRLAVLL